ncbi:MAG: Uma2 family endonuclease [Deltaproteobacteria bacterium]|nr:Uma2 family endonuclease [Deltaproteobacteria bacterium]
MLAAQLDAPAAHQRGTVVYPDSDGQPMADNTLQFNWIVLIKENLDSRLADFVGGDLLWYPVLGDPKTRVAPDVLVALGRPKGYRGSYKQWEENDVPPRVVFEILSPGNRPAEMMRKQQFYDRFGVDEYYVIDPDESSVFGFVREGNKLVSVPAMDGFVSPSLGIRFELGERLVLRHPDGTSFSTLAEERRRADEERARADEEKVRAEASAQRAEVLAAKLRAAGLDPDA